MAKSAEPLQPIYLVKEEARPLQEMLPWMTYISDNVILNKDGSLLAGFEFSGLDPDNIDDELVNRAVEELERAINANLDERVTLWITTKRKKAY
ncbi:hypothetical protein, partial [Paraburkholderia caledonica]|uniref:hypothetical protein n=1 Tax=Paraburkholderia caledonica TaxID=134536 RepID=UPI0011781B0C